MKQCRRTKNIRLIPCQDGPVGALMQNCQKCLHRKEKLFDIPVPSRDVTYQTLLGREL
jgi:hypothetical protein